MYVYRHIWLSMSNSSMPCRFFSYSTQGITVRRSGLLCQMKSRGKSP